MKWLANIVMGHRAVGLVRRFASHLPSEGRIADVGSGTGHNAEQLRRSTRLTVDEYDVADLHWVGPGPTMLRGTAIPASDQAFESLLLLYVLQYPECVCALLSEARRVTRGTVIVVQSTYSGRLGLFVLRLREVVWGRMAFSIAAWMRLVKSNRCPLAPQHFFTRQELFDEFQQSGFVVRTMETLNWPGLNVSRDLFVLEAAAI